MQEKRAYVICHMMTSLDGKITGPFFSMKECDVCGEFYDEEIAKLAPKAWGCGRTTFEENYQSALAENLNLDEFKDRKVEKGDYLVKSENLPYAIAFDRKGRLNWKQDKIEYPDGVFSKVLEVVTALAPSSYLAYLRKIAIPYIIAGQEDLDAGLFLHKLYEEFGIERFALCGGGNINAAFMKDNLVDEISLVTAPVIDGESHGLSFVEKTSPRGFPRAYTLKDAVKLPDGGLWLTYLKK